MNTESIKKACLNARSLEEIMLDWRNVENFDEDTCEEVIERCNQIISCMEQIMED